MTPDSIKIPTKVFSWKKAVVVCVGVGVFALMLSVYLQTRSATLELTSGQDSASASAVATKAATAVGSGSSFEVPGKPSRLIIPAIGVNANVQSVGDWWRDPSQIGIPTNFTDVAWYNKGPLPGEPGSAVIDGHLDGKDVKQAVFYNLGDLKPGDDVEIEDAAGKIIHFTVLGTKLYSYNATTTEIFAAGDSKIRLNLITCGGDWIKSEGQYSQRVVVFTELNSSPEAST